MDAYLSKIPGAERNGDGIESESSHDPPPERPPKRLKTADTEQPASEGTDESSSEADLARRRDKHEGPAEKDKSRKTERTTDVENVLPPTQTDDRAIEEYELARSSQTSSSGQGAAETSRPVWVKGRSSIYVDAFNLALDVVLEEESQLFDEREAEVFRQWRELPYEAQFLYVRLFLRKTAAWHRSSRLGYHADVSDPLAAMESLQKTRRLPKDDVAEGLSPSLNPDGDRLDESFSFADASEDYITTIDEAASLLYLDELKTLAKEAKVRGRNKAELIRGLCRTCQQQAGLMAVGLSRHNSRDSDTSPESGPHKLNGAVRLRREDSSREQHFLDKILSMTGPCIRLSPAALKLFERVHLVFYRSTEWTEKSLTTIILAKIARRNFPEYIVCRTSNIFASRQHLMDFEGAIRMEAEVDHILEFNGPPSVDDLQRIVSMFEKIHPRWQRLVAEEREKERTLYEMGEGAYLRRFNPAHTYTRIIHKALYVFGRRKDHGKEYGLLVELLEQKLFHPARRGAWYQRKALLEEHYMAKLDGNGWAHGAEQRKRHWLRMAATTCETGLQDPDCHLIHHHDLQKRLLKLEKKLRIPRRLQHDFGHVRLARPLEMTVEGVQVKRKPVVKAGGQAASTKTIWVDELDTGGECSVEEMCLSHFRQQGWKGYHAEGGVLRTVFAYLFYDILFLYMPNVFQTAYQTCPLDLHTDAFFPARASEINHRLVEIGNGEGERLLRGVWQREHERRPSVVGLKWDFDVEDLAELVRCFEGGALAAVCKVMAQEYRQRGGGVPDLVLWRRGADGADEADEARGSAGAGTRHGSVMFVEVKSANDVLSDTQRLWMHVLTGAGVAVALCNAVARELRDED